MAKPTVLVFFAIGAIALLVRTPAVTGRSSGAPSWACSSLTPQHLAINRLLWTQPACPFQVSVSPKEEKGKGVLLVSIIPLPDTPANETFRGFVVQARLATNLDTLVDGTFVPQEAEKSKAFTCGSGKKGSNTWTHSNANPKLTLDAFWFPPANFSGNEIKFQATIVAQRTLYWEKQFSKSIAIATN